MDTPIDVTTPVIASVQHALADLGAVRTGIVRGDTSDRELVELVEGLMALQRQVKGTVSVAMAAADARNAAMRTLGTPLEAVLTRSGQESAKQVRNQVFQAGILATRPKVHAAAAAGRITLGQANAIREVVAGLPATLGATQKEKAEALLLTAADRLPADVLRGMTDTILDQIAPDTKDTPAQREAKLEARDARARQRRSLRFGIPTDGSIDIHGSLPVLEGTRLKNLVEGIAARDYRTARDTADRTRLATTPDQRLADALMTVIAVAETGRLAETLLPVVAAQSGYLPDASLPTPDAPKSEHRTGPECSRTRPGRGIPPAAAQITVLMHESDLRDRAHASGLLADGTPISARELRRLLCDAEILPAVLGGTSEILDLGRGRRLASPAQRHAISLRDGHCAFPGCQIPMHRCEIHHIDPWQCGGPTDLDNLVALCVRHHQLCEPAPPITDTDGYAQAPDQWTIGPRKGLSPQFVPPTTLRTIGPATLANEPPRLLHALTLFHDHAPALATTGSGRGPGPAP